MKNIGDVHRKTRRIGKIVGYGHQIVDGLSANLIVRTVKGMGLNRKKRFPAWRQTQFKEPTQPA